MGSRTIPNTRLSPSPFIYRLFIFNRHRIIHVHIQMQHLQLLSRKWIHQKYMIYDQCNISFIAVFSTIAEHLVPLPNLSIFVHYAPVLLITPYTPTRLIHCSFNLRFMKIWKDLVFHEKKYLHNIPVLRTLRNTGEWATKCSMILKTNDWPNSNAKIQTNLLFNISSLIISSTES